MQHLNTKVDFQNIEPFEKINYDPQLVIEGRQEGLKRFVKTHYCQDYDNNRDFDLSYTFYQDMINSAIKNNNLMALEILWQGIYWHDRDHPDFIASAYTAAEFGTLTMFQHCLYGFMNYATFDLFEINVDKLCQRAERNPNKEVLKFVQLIAPCATNGKLEQLSKRSLNQIDNEDPDYYQACVKFYQLIESC